MDIIGNKLQDVGGCDLWLHKTQLRLQRHPMEVMFKNNVQVFVSR